MFIFTMLYTVSIVFSYAIIDSQSTVLVDEQRVFAILNSAENYESLRLSCIPIFSNDLLRGKEIAFEFIFGGDMKFIQIMLGLFGSLADFLFLKLMANKKEKIAKEIQEANLHFLLDENYSNMTISEL